MHRAYLLYILHWDDHLRTDIVEFPDHGYAKAAGEAMQRLVKDAIEHSKAGAIARFHWTTINNEQDKT